jgi:hypothetical protein
VQILALSFIRLPRFGDGAAIRERELIRNSISLSHRHVSVSLGQLETHRLIELSLSKRPRFGAWMTSLEARASRNVLIIAMANKLAGIAWAALSNGKDYRAPPTLFCPKRDGEFSER